MSLLAQRFEKLKQQGKTALIPYITAGDPLPEITVELMRDLVSAGADVIELGVPFSDPMADGPVIQRASERALEYHVSLSNVLEMVKQFRNHDGETPVVLMGYLNPIEIMGYENFAERAADAGVDGVLIVDVPPEEGEALQAILKAWDLDQIYLIAPTSTEERIQRICDLSSDLESHLEQVRRRTTLPVGVGFGIKDAATAAAVGEMADAVVVGSALVSRVEALADQPEKIGASLRELLVSMRQALDAGG
ncbi:MAG: tryptophan synthase subunit alpha [Candidatus Thiodiazotropha sp.]